MARFVSNVKERCRYDKLMEFVDKHPRTGWFLSGLLIFNTFLNILDLFL
jgi:hypothetical protein